jgi:hypothetical protein
VSRDQWLKRYIAALARRVATVERDGRINWQNFQGQEVEESR